MYIGFQHEISDHLWGAINRDYDNENYTGAILGSIFLLAETIRERTDLDLDGIALIGKAFGGANPLLKVNNLKTESEKNEQRGVENILRGLFQGIRNPRSHEKISDDKKTCDSIVIFINYLLNIIEKSKAPFDLESFCNRVFDADFVETKHYAELLIEEIPEKKKHDVLFEILNRRKKIKPQILSYIIEAFFDKATDDFKKEVIEYASDILNTTDENHDFRLFTTVFQKEKWLDLQLTARLRCENKMLKSFLHGSYDTDSNQCTSGALGAWLNKISTYLHLKGNFRDALIKKLASDDYYEIEYIFKYFRGYINDFQKEPEITLLNAIKKGLEKGDKRFYELMDEALKYGEYEWPAKIKAYFEYFEEKDLKPISIPDDDIPF